MTCLQKVVIQMELYRIIVDDLFLKANKLLNVGLMKIDEQE